MIDYKLTPKQLAAQMVAACIHHSIVAQQQAAHFKAQLSALTPHQRDECERHVEVLTKQVMASTHAYGGFK